MIVPDVNLLIYAYASDSPFHAKAAGWWEKRLSSPEPVGLVPVVLFGFVRIVTHARVFRHPMTANEATGHVRSWLAQPCVQVLESSAEHVVQVLELLDRAGSAGNLVTDAQIAAVAIEHEAVIHTADSDFLRFPGLRWLNPITGTASSGLRRT